jgi:hypothetical protein
MNLHGIIDQAIRQTRSRSKEDFMSDIGSITRRAALGGVALGVGAAALGDSDALAQADARKTFVLIHGASHGGWCWRKVVDILEKRGHKVYAPSLTGLADRSHLCATLSATRGAGDIATGKVELC